MGLANTDDPRDCLRLSQQHFLFSRDLRLDLVDTFRGCQKTYLESRLILA